MWCVNEMHFSKYDMNYILNKCDSLLNIARKVGVNLYNGRTSFFKGSMAMHCSYSLCFTYHFRLNTWNNTMRRDDGVAISTFSANQECY